MTGEGALHMNRVPSNLYNEKDNTLLLRAMLTEQLNGENKTNTMSCVNKKNERHPYIYTGHPSCENTCDSLCPE